MSSQTKDPLEKQDTPSESSESHSESEVEKAEENLEHLQIEERVVKEETKGDTEEPKPLDSPNQEETLTSRSYLFDDPSTGPSELLKPRLTSSDPGPKDVGKLIDKKELQERAVSENTGIKMVEEDFYIAYGPQSSTESSSTNFPLPNIKAPSAIPSRLLVQKSEIPSFHYEGLPSALHHSPGSRRYDFATDSANTSSDVSEIRSEVAEISTEGSVYQEAADIFQKEDSPSVYEPAVERQSSEASDTNISDLQDESAPLPTPTPSTSVSISTNTGEQGHQAYLAQLQREADERGVPISTSSGIGSTNQSELSHLKRWGAVGEIGFYRPNLEDIIDDQEISEHGARGEEPQPAAECMEDEPILEGGGKQESDRLLQQERQSEESNKAEIEACRIKQVEEGQVSDVLEVSPSVRRKTSKCLSDSTSAENIVSKLRPRIGKKSKMVASKSIVTSRSSSESTEPKSSSSDELHRKESPEIKSSSGSQDPSHSEKGRKSWQKFGQLRSMQLSAVPSKDSVITEEEEDQLSPQRVENPELMETKEISPEKMETTPEKGVEDATKTEPSSLEATDQAYGSKTETTLKEPELRFEVSEFERSVGKSKRPGGKLSSSPDERQGSTPPKASTSRPKKKARADKKRGKACRTRHDSGGSVPISVGLDRLKEETSTSTPDPSDYSESDDDDNKEGGDDNKGDGGSDGYDDDPSVYEESTAL